MGFEFSVRDRLQKLQDKVVIYSDMGNEIAIQKNHNVKILEVEMTQAAALSVLSKDGKTLTNFQFTFERQTNQLTNISDRCAAAMAEAARVFAPNEEWQRELTAIRQQNYENQGPDAQQIERTTVQIENNKEGVLMNYLGMQQHINKSIDHFAQARDMEYERKLREADEAYARQQVRKAQAKMDSSDSSDDKPYKPDKPKPTPGKGKTKLSAIEQEQALRDRAKTHGKGNKRPGTIPDDSDEEFNVAKRTDEGVTDISEEISKAKPNFNQSKSGNAEPDQNVKVPAKPKPTEQYGMVERGNLSGAISRKLQKVWHDEGLRSKYQGVPRHQLLHAFLYDQFDKLDTNDTENFKDRTGQVPAFFEEIFNEQRKEYEEILRKDIEAAQKIRSHIMNLITNLSTKRALKFGNFSTWYQQSVYNQENPYKKLPELTKTSLNTFRQEYEKQKAVEKSKVGFNQSPQSQNKPAKPAPVRSILQTETLTSLKEELIAMEKTIAGYETGSFFKNYYSRDEKVKKRDRAVRNLIADIDSFLAKFKASLSKNGLKGSRAGREAKDDLEGRWTRLLGIPWYVPTNKGMGTVNVGETRPLVSENWYSAIQWFGSFESNFTSPVFLRTELDAEIVNRNYAPEFNGITPLITIQITILYLIKQKLDYIRRFAFGIVKGVNVLGEQLVSTAHVKFPDAVRDGKYNASLRSQKVSRGFTRDVTGGSTGPQAKKSKTNPKSPFESLPDPAEPSMDVDHVVDLTGTQEQEKTTKEPWIPLHDPNVPGWKDE